MGSGCGDPIVERIPSSAGQLPVPAALNARSPTLFIGYYTRKDWNCKGVSGKIRGFLPSKKGEPLALPFMLWIR